MLDSCASSPTLVADAPPGGLHQRLHSSIDAYNQRLQDDLDRAEGARDDGRVDEVAEILEAHISLLERFKGELEVLVAAAVDDRVAG